MREKRLRWNERSGEVRPHEASRSGAVSVSRRRALIIGLVAVAIGAVAWSYWQSQPPARVAQSQADTAELGPAVSPGAGWAPEGPVLEGRVTRITDGDTIEVQLGSGPIKVRFDSVDAPERKQPGGAEATAALERRLAGQAVAVEPIEQDQYGRMIGVVYLGEENINAWLVREGYAWTYRQYAHDRRYCEAESAARSEKRGVWARPLDEQQAPWEWRAVKRGRGNGFTDYSHETAAQCVTALGKKPAAAPFASQAETPKVTDGAPPDGCRIKGNISSSGKIFHVPGSAAYEKTRIDTAKGERWFCSEAEARDAGWRAPRG